MNGLTTSLNAAASLVAQEGINKGCETPAPEPLTSFTALKNRIKQHYELASDYYFSLW